MEIYTTKYSFKEIKLLKIFDVSYAFGVVVECQLSNLMNQVQTPSWTQ